MASNCKNIAGRTKLTEPVHINWFGIFSVILQTKYGPIHRSTGEDKLKFANNEWCQNFQSVTHLDRLNQKHSVIYLLTRSLEYERNLNWNQKGVFTSKYCKLPVGVNGALSPSSHTICSGAATAVVRTNGVRHIWRAPLCIKNTERTVESRVGPAPNAVQE